jgi:murein L,D-transpeptidase YafK
MINFGWRSLNLLLFSFLFFAFTFEKPAKKKTNFMKPATVAKKTASAVTTKYNPYYIIVDKSDYELKVYDDEGWYATYPVVFGSKDQNDKYMEGDKRTPEGEFKVLLKKIHPKWGPELLLDFPNEESKRKFNERRGRGLVPKNAKIGGGIAIHATRPQEEWTVDYYQNWTDGCVSLKYTEAKDLYSYIPAGTPVTIQK